MYYLVQWTSTPYTSQPSRRMGKKSYRKKQLYVMCRSKSLWGKALRDMAQKNHAIYVPDDERDDIPETIFFREELGYVDATDYITEVEISNDEYDDDS
eukprot:3793933-Ditylum_brightwellii.AAC.1